MRTSAGWCTGRPSDHGVAEERDVAAIQLAAYPGTTCIRDFRTGAPSVGWWSSQSMAAAGAVAVRPRQFDVYFSWTDVLSKPLRPVLETAPPWVDRIILTGVHEMHSPSKGYNPGRYANDMEWITNEIPDSMRSRVFRAPTFIYYRSRISAPGETGMYITPLLADGLIDGIMWDGYPSNPADVGRPGGATDPTDYEPVPSFMQHAREWMTETNMPYGWGELNFARRNSDPTGRRRAQWFDGVFRETRADDGICVCLFHHNLADLLAELGHAEDDAWAAICRESEAGRLAYGDGYQVAQIDAGAQYDAGLRDAYEDVAIYANQRLGKLNRLDRVQ